MAYRRRRRVSKRRLIRRKGRRIHGVTAVGFRGAYPNTGMTSVGIRRRGRLVGMLKGKRRAGTLTRPSKRRKFSDPAGVQQWQRFKFAKKLGKLTVKKQISALSEVFDLMWRNVGILKTRGNLFMNNFQVVNPAAPDSYARPIYLVDLTSAITYGGTASPVVRLARVTGTTRGPDPGNADVAAYNFTVINGLNSTGANSTLWQVARMPGGTAAVSDKAILKWSEIRIDMWGAKNRPAEFQLTLCQFDERCLPADPKIESVLYDPTGIEFWDQLSQKLIFNPGLRRPTTNLPQNLMKVLDRRTFMINPSTTIDNDADPTCKTARLFYNLNRKVNFSWSNSGVPLPAQDVDPAGSTAFTSANGNYQSPYAHPRARVFLMITSTNFRGTQVGATESSDDTSSINLGVYNRWVDGRW